MQGDLLIRHSYANEGLNTRLNHCIWCDYEMKSSVWTSRTCTYSDEGERHPLSQLVSCDQVSIFVYTSRLFLTFGAWICIDVNRVINLMPICSVALPLINPLQLRSSKCRRKQPWTWVLHIRTPAIFANWAEDMPLVDLE